MKRRATLGAALLGWFVALPLRLHAQQPAKLKLVGQLGQSSPQNAMLFLAHVKRDLRELGWVEGVNVAFVFRVADGQADHLPQLAREIVALKPDVITVVFSPAASALKEATQTIPVVVAIADPVGTGLAQSLARPGGNFTGLSMFTTELAPKLIELLRNALPSVTRVGVLWNPDNASTLSALKELQRAADALHVTLVPIEARNLSEVEPALSRMSHDAVKAVVITSDGVYFAHTQRIGELLLQYKLPGIAQGRVNLSMGVLMTYGISMQEVSQRMAYYIDRILRGANPAELPIQQPNRLELVVNMKAAKAHGIAVPQSVLIRADEVIE